MYTFPFQLKKGIGTDGYGEPQIRIGYISDRDGEEEPHIRTGYIPDTDGEEEPHIRVGYSSDADGEEDPPPSPPPTLLARKFWRNMKNYKNLKT